MLLVVIGGLAPAATAATVPTAPRSVAAIGQAGAVKVTWQAPSSTGGARIDRYKVVIWAADVARRGVTAPADARMRRITNLTPGTRYSMLVRARNAQGWGPASRTVTAVPTALRGFGTIRGACGVVAPQLDEATPSLFSDRALDFGSDPYDDPADRPRLTAGGQEIVEDGNAGGSSLIAEVFAFETLARCEMASLLKTETEIVYDEPGKIVDLLVAIDGSKVGVSVTRAVSFPFDAPYTEEAATELLNRKLDDLVASSHTVSEEDAWVKGALVVVAYAQQHADTIEAAWQDLDAATKADTVVYVIRTDGSDTNVYSNS
jgi:hypothetical protein